MSLESLQSLGEFHANCVNLARAKGFYEGLAYIANERQGKPAKPDLKEATQQHIARLTQRQYKLIQDTHK